MPDIFTKIHVMFIKRWKKPEATTFIADKLDEIVNRRHKVAHTGVALDITRGQLSEALRFLRILSTLLDRQLHTHVKSLYPPP